MYLFEEHIKEYLNPFIEGNYSDFFIEVFEKINFEEKEQYKKLLKYLFAILEAHCKNQSDDLECLNIHFGKNLNELEKTLIIEFLWHYLFIKQYNLESSIDNNEVLINKIDELEKQVSRPLVLPSSNRKVEIRKIRERRKFKRKHLKYYKSLRASTSLNPNTLINFKVSQEKEIDKYFKNIPTYLTIDQLNGLNSYVIHNSEDFNRVRNAKAEGIYILKLIENIILFDCESSTKRFSQFNFRQLTNLNIAHGTNFKLFLIITFPNNENINDIKNKTSRLLDSYYIPKKSSYVVTKSEYNLLVNNKITDEITIDFINPSNSSFWEDFYYETKINSLYELRSIKMLNIYSLCYNDKIKNYILNDIFSPEETPSLITQETKDSIINLPQKDANNIKYSLSSTLDLIIKSNLKNHIISHIDSQTKIVFDYLTLNCDELLSLVKSALNINSNKNLILWDDINKASEFQILILAYRDQGNYNFYFYPNINELDSSNLANVKSVFPALLFNITYKWSKYRLLSEYHKKLDHLIRQKYFNWDDLNNRINNSRPESPVDIYWELESEYSSTEVRVTYRITFNDNTRLTLNPSALIIYREEGLKNSLIQNIKWIEENINIEDNDLEIQSLDELIELFNPAEKLIDIKQQERDLRIIRNQFELEDESANRLWKVLLARKAEELGNENLYRTLEILFDKNNIPLVSYNHFLSTWINPDSSSLVPRGNKIFKVLCDYLKLPIAYRRIIYTIKNRTTSGRRNATRIYSKLLRDLFADNCFDEENNVEDILTNNIEHYKNTHNLDELGINEESPIPDLVTLIELIKPELSFKKVKNIQINEL